MTHSSVDTASSRSASHADLTSENPQESIGVNEGSGAKSNTDSSVRVGPKREGQQGQGQQSPPTQASLSGGQIPKPDAKANPNKGQSTISQIANLLFEVADKIMERRADRAKQMKEISTTLAGLAAEKSEKNQEMVERAAKKKKSGIFGKILAVAGMIVAAIVLVFSSMAFIAAAPFSGGASLAGFAASIPLALAIIGGILGTLVAVDTVANEGKLTQKVTDATIGNIVKYTAKLFEKMGMPEKVAQGLALAATLVLMLVAVILVTKGAGAASAGSTASSTAANTAVATGSAAANVARSGQIAAGAAKGGQAAAGAAKGGQAAAGAAKGGQAAAGAAKGGQAAAGASNTDDIVRGSSAAAKGADVGADAASKGKRGKEVLATVGNSDDEILAAQASKKYGLWTKASGYAQMGEGAIQLGTTAHKASIEFYNAQLAWLVAQDQADLEKLQAVIQLITALLDTHDELSTAETEAYKKVLDQLTKFITVDITAMQRPLVRA